MTCDCTKYSKKNPAFHAIHGHVRIINKENTNDRRYFEK